MLQELKTDNVDFIKKYYNDNGINTVGNVLKNGYPGNTLLHEAIAYKCEKYLILLLKTK